MQTQGTQRHITGILYDNGSYISRDGLIKAGRLWQVYPKSDIDDIIFESTHKAECHQYAVVNYGKAYYKSGIGVGRVIWEAA